MDKQVGLLIMKDENDILEEYLTKITKSFDKILILDGSDDYEGRDIASKFSEVIFYERDENIKDIINDSTTRGFLWEQAKNLVDNKQWVGILHPDEFPEHDPLDLLRMVEANKESYKDFKSISVKNLHFFLHSSQREEWSFEKGDLIEPKMKWFMGPGHTERRFFVFDKNLSYGRHHSTTVPPQAEWPLLETDFRFKQFSYRSKEQILKRAKTRFESNWQKDDYLLVLETQDMFFDTLAYPAEFSQKYPVEYSRCWYNKPYAYVDKL